MGYALSTLGNLPIQDDISLYVFVIGGGWQGGHGEIIERNFMRLAQRIGKNAVLAKGFEPESWSTQVCAKYLGKGADADLNLVPALLITDAHPEKLNDRSLRLLVPLRDAERRFGGVDQFFDALSDFAVTKNPGFLARFEEKTSVAKTLWSAVELKPNLFGFGVNLKNLINPSEIDRD